MRASDKAYAALMREIVEGALAPGTVLGEVETSSRLGVSRTPLREALSRLTADGLVMAQSGRGVVVTEVSLDNITELYEVREALEEQAARLAAHRRQPGVFEKFAVEFSQAPALIDSGDEGIRQYYDLNKRLDDAIDESLGNEYMVTALRSVRTHLSRVRRMAAHNPVRLKESAAETALIVEAIVDGDAALAAHATHVHLHRSLTHVRAQVARTLHSVNVA
jgi:DNA-binding GntR family transcriptional regulator